MKDISKVRNQIKQKEHNEALMDLIKKRKIGKSQDYKAISSASFKKKENAPVLTEEMEGLNLNDSKSYNKFTSGMKKLLAGLKQKG